MASKLLCFFIFLFRTFLWVIKPSDGIVDGTFQPHLVSSIGFISEFLVGEGARLFFAAVAASSSAGKKKEASAK